MCKKYSFRKCQFILAKKTFQDFSDIDDVVDEFRTRFS